MSTTPDPGPPGARTIRRTYRPGSWFGIVGEHAVAALPPTEKHRVPALWELIDGGAGFDVVLDALISAGLRELPGFVLVSTSDGRTQVVLRGAATAELDVAGETVVLEGSVATTWVERTLDGVTRTRLLLDHSPADADEDASYTVDGGLFRMSRYAETSTPEGDDASDVDTEPHAGPEPAGAAPAVERSPEPPSWTPPPPAVTPPPPAQEPADHDGLTRTGSWQPPAPAAPGIPGQPPAPDVTRSVARLELSGGEVVEVDRAVVFGRAPEPRRFSPNEQPRLVTVHSPQLEVSSTHLEIRPGVGADHGSAVATDLGSTNGTVLVQAGMPPHDLEPGRAVQLLPGAVLDLGDGVLIRVSQPAR